jgi:DNA-binding MarR family transcriptional regulator
VADVTFVQYRALVIIAANGPLNLATLAKHLDLQPPAATRLCDRLSRKSLIHRQRSASSGRSIEISLTERGATLVADVQRRRKSALEAVLQKLDPAQQIAVRDALVAFAEAAGEVRDLPGAKSIL